jgi:hypothetical protein
VRKGLGERELENEIAALKHEGKLGGGAGAQGRDCCVKALELASVPAFNQASKNLL